VHRIGKQGDDTPNETLNIDVTTAPRATGRPN